MKINASDEAIGAFIALNISHVAGAFIGEAKSRLFAWYNTHFENISPHGAGVDTSRRGATSYFTSTPRHANAGALRRRRPLDGLLNQRPASAISTPATAFDYQAYIVSLSQQRALYIIITSCVAAYRRLLSR